MAQGKKPRSSLTVFEVLQSGFDQNSSKNKGLSKAKDSKKATKEVHSQPTAELSPSPEMEQECGEMHAFQTENQGFSLQGQKFSDDATMKNQNASKHNGKNTPCKISNMQSVSLEHDKGVSNKKIGEVNRLQYSSGDEPCKEMLGEHAALRAERLALLKAMATKARKTQNASKNNRKSTTK